MKVFLNDEKVLEAGRNAGVTDEQVRRARDLCVKYTPEGLAYLDEDFWNTIRKAKKAASSEKHGTT